MKYVAAVLLISALALLAFVIPRIATAEPTGRTVEATYQGRPLMWWVGRAVQNRRNSNARGLTIRRLRGQLRAGFMPVVWERVGWCESGLRWHLDDDFDGGVQFHPDTWRRNRLPGYPPFAYQATPFQQLVVAEIVRVRQGWRAWPNCSRRLGLR